MDYKSIDTPSKDQTTTLPFEQTGYFSPIICDYINRDKKLDDFYKYIPQLSSFEQVIADKKNNAINRPVLVEALKRQYASTSNSPNATTLIESLLSEDTFTVTTGHQLNIFGGPLYFVYKIISTINLAKAIEKENPGRKIIPIYWMATEDHDFAEINHINLFNKTIDWPLDATGPTGRISTKTFTDTLEQLKKIVGNSEDGEKIIRLFSNAYLKNENLAKATFHFVNELFGKYGLLIIDGDDPQLKALFKPIIQKDVFENISNARVAQTDEKLNEKGYKSQAFSRDINFFYLDDDVRERIERDAETGNYQVLNTSLLFSEKELRDLIDAQPEKLSPNVILRPLYQEVILPNLSYTGGGGELAYWMQLKSTFEHYSVNFPVLMLRNSALLIDAACEKKLSKLQLDSAQLFKPEHELVNAYVNTHSDNEVNLDADLLEIEKIFKSISNKAIEIDPSLKSSAEAEKTRIINSLKGFESKIQKANKRQFETETEQLVRLRQRLFPENGLQERYDNFIPYYLKNGDGFITQLLQELDPFINKFLIILLANIPKQ